MREMPGSAEFAPIYPKFGATFTPTLVSGLLSCCFVVIHDFVRFDTAFGYEIMHSSSVYSMTARILQGTGTGVALPLMFNIILE